MPPFEVRPVPEGERLRRREIVALANVAVVMGFRKLRLTGGEPLTREDVAEIVASLSSIRGIEDLSMTTNGLLLAPLALSLKRAGLQRINVSLDTMDPDRYAELTRGGDLKSVLAGLKVAQGVGLAPIKLNCVVEKSADEPDARSVARFARESGFEARFIRRMSLADGAFWPVQGGRGGDCPRCDRLRVTCDGIVRPCLFGDAGFSIRELGAQEALRRAVEHKPESGKVCLQSEFYAVGG
jgi:cyclic pyranopterin phosphate synthase